MYELEPDNIHFSHDRQYQITGWRIFFETMKKYGADIHWLSTHLTHEERNKKALVSPVKTIRRIGYVATHDMANIEREISSMADYKSPHNIFVNQTIITKRNDRNHPVNRDMLDTLQLFYSEDILVEEDINRFHLRRFDKFVYDTSENNIINFTLNSLEKAIKGGDDEEIISAFSGVQRDGDFYAGEWDKDRMIAEQKAARQLLGQQSQMPQSSPQPQPVQPGRLRASA